MNSLERRLARLEPPPAGHRLHVIEAASDEDAATMFQAIGEKPGDLCIWIKRYEKVPRPARHLYSMSANGPYRGERIVFEGADAEL